MAITTSGGSGTGTVSTGANAIEVETIFTTPNTANALFLVEVWLYGPTGVGYVSYAPAGVASGGFPAAVWKESPNSPKCVFRGVYGPNVPVNVAIENSDNAAAVTSFSYSYLGMVVT